MTSDWPQMSKMAKEIAQLKSRIADLETIIDEIPNLGALFAAVQELQEEYEAPAARFINYIGGARR